MNAAEKLLVNDAITVSHSRRSVVEVGLLAVVSEKGY